MLFPIRTTAHVGRASWNARSFIDISAGLDAMEADARGEHPTGNAWQSLDAIIFLAEAGGDLYQGYLQCLVATLPGSVHLWRCGKEWVQTTHRVPQEDLDAGVSAMFLLMGQGSHRGVMHLAQWLHTFLAWEQREQVCRELLQGGMLEVPLPLAYTLIGADDRVKAYWAAQTVQGVRYHRFPSQTKGKK